MKKKLIFFLAVLTVGCSSKPITAEPAQVVTVQTEVVSSFQSLLDSNALTGVIVIFDASVKTFYANDFAEAHSGFLPASTFKIPNSIIALETGVVENDSTLFEWDGQKRAFRMWEEDMIFSEAFQRSCVPCYQEVAQRIGVKRMNAYLQKLDYPDMVVDSSNLDLFWLIGEAKITAMEQINFIQRLHNGQLPIANRTTNTLKEMMRLTTTPSYQLYGKTGWAFDEEQPENNIGWFVGYLEKEEQLYYFATRVSPTLDFDMHQFSVIRKQVTMEAFGLLNII